jgi:hypothetical protein
VPIGLCIFFIQRLNLLLLSVFAYFAAEKYLYKCIYPFNHQSVATQMEVYGTRAPKPGHPFKVQIGRTFLIPASRSPKCADVIIMIRRKFDVRLTSNNRTTMEGGTKGSPCRPTQGYILIIHKYSKQTMAATAQPVVTAPTAV